MDAHATQFNGDALERTLRAQNRWDVYERHVVQVYEVLTQMSRNGLPYDKEEAAKFQVKLEAMKKERESALQTLVPDALKYGKQKLGYKTVPKEIVAALADAPELDKFSRTEDEENDDGLMEQVEIKYEKRPFTIARADATKAELAAIPDGEGEIVVHRWVRIKPFLPTSWQQLLKLIKFYGQSPGVNRKTKKETTDDETLRKLIKKCSQSRKPEEKEFAEVLKMCRECRQLGKVLGTYVKGYVPGRDNKIHSTPGFWGKMMRISWRRPNISATIADKQEEYIAKGFRRCIASESGKLLVEADWRAIEARLVAYFAGDKDYDRLARLGVHDYLACHILAERKKLSKSSIPNVNAPDSELKAIFKEVKSKFPKDRDDAKHIVHGTNYGMTPFLMAEMYEMPLAEAKRLQAIYFQLFPKIILWQNSVIDRADREGKLTNPYSYQMPFWDVRRWNSKYQRWDRGDDAKSAVSFLPRDTAAAMLKEVLLRLRYLADDGRMLCSTHDSILTQVPERDAESMGRLLYTEMTKPVEPLGGLVVDVEVAVGKTWSKDEMEVLDLKALATVG